MVEWNDTRADYPSDALVQSLFEDQVARQPEAVAAVFGDTELTYAQLDARANQLAHRLRANGARDGDCVAIYLERSLDLPLAVLAVLKAGCVYIPLDPIYPDERVNFILDQADVRLLLTQTALAAAIPSYSGVRIFSILKPTISPRSRRLSAARPPISPTSYIRPARPAVPKASRSPIDPSSTCSFRWPARQASTPPTCCWRSPRLPSTSPASS